MPGLTGDGVLGLPVRLRGIVLGRATDLVLHPQEARVVGLDVLCGDDLHRFLPYPVASIRRDGIEVNSPLVLIEAPVDSFYRYETRSLNELRGSRIGSGGGRLCDVVIGDEGAIEAVIVEDADGRRRLPLGGGLVLPRPERPVARRGNAA